MSIYSIWFKVNNNKCTCMQLHWGGIQMGDAPQKRQQLFTFSLIKSPLQSHAMSIPAICPPTHRQTITNTRMLTKPEQYAHAQEGTDKELAVGGLLVCLLVLAVVKDCPAYSLTNSKTPW